MLIIANSAALAHALNSLLDPLLKALLTFRHDQITADGIEDIGDIARYVIAQPGDTLEAIEVEAGLPIATNIVDGARFPCSAFEPNWECCFRHGDTLWEAVFILSDDGFGTVLIVMDQEGTDPTLLDLCRAHGLKGERLS